MKNYKKHLVALLFLCSCIWLVQCTKTISDTTENPFTEVNQSNDSSIVSLKNLEGLHKSIFSLKCANPTCHDGSFEPDFRTIQSTYASLVYHPVTKNDDDETYKYRVWPGEPDSSWLYRRITGDEQLGRMPLYAEPLSTTEISAIKTWIENGAKDIFNNTAGKPNLAPIIAGYGLFDASFTRLDTVRTNGFASNFIVNANLSGNLAIAVTDAESDLADFTSANVTFSYNRDQWNTIQTLSLTKLLDDAMVTPFSANQFLPDTIIYFRAEVTDEGGAKTIFPNLNSPFYWKENFSFSVSP